MPSLVIIWTTACWLFWEKKSGNISSVPTCRYTPKTASFWYCWSCNAICRCILNDVLRYIQLRWSLAENPLTLTKLRLVQISLRQGAIDLAISYHAIQTDLFCGAECDSPSKVWAKRGMSRKEEKTACNPRSKVWQRRTAWQSSSRFCTRQYPFLYYSFISQPFTLSSFISQSLLYQQIHVLAKHTLLLFFILSFFSSLWRKLTAIRLKMQGQLTHSLHRQFPRSDFNIMTPPLFSSSPWWLYWIAFPSKLPRMHPSCLGQSYLNIV